jgi:hypothetical protein
MSKMELGSNIRCRHCAVLIKRPRHRKLPDADTPKAPYCRWRTTQHGPPTDAGAVEYRGSRTASRSAYVAVFVGQADLAVVVTFARSSFRWRLPAGVARIGNIKPTSGRLLCSTRCGMPARTAGCGIPPVQAGRAGRPAVSRVPG